MAELDLDAVSRHPVVRKLTEKVKDSLGLHFLFVSPKARVEGIPPGQFMPTTNALCTRICTDAKKGMKACLSAGNALFNAKRLPSADFIQKPCHIGLQTLGAPIVVDGQLLGLIATCGFMRAEHVFEEEQAVAHRAARQGWAPGFDEALAQLRQTPSLNVREVRIAADLMQLLIEQLIHFSRSSEADAEALQRAWQALEVSCPESPLLGRSEKLRAVATVVDRSASKRLPTLITGPQGAGATHLARHLHRAGGFVRSPFVSLEARDGLPTARGLIKKGFTGTLLMEHLELASTQTQDALVELMHASREVFWISTTREPLEPGVASAVGVVHVTLPPLKERAEDVAELAQALLARLGSAHPLAPAVLSALERYAWPGNVAELEAVLRRALALGGLSLAHLPREVAMLSARTRRRAGFHDEVLQFKTELVAETLERTSGNVSQAARELGLQRTYLHRLMNELGVHPQRAGRDSAPE
ncbi:MAG: PocR ligand-binding domain-containing protein [Myxococcus sp.]|nr:PocR ligand-binding domain-containing protein [Myxococcus sp.]